MNAFLNVSEDSVCEEKNKREFPLAIYIRLGLVDYRIYAWRDVILENQSRTNGPINAHLTIAQLMPRYNLNNEKKEALL